MRPTHDVSVIETPENLEISLPLAGIGSRFLAYLVDLAWQSVAVVAAIAVVVVRLPSTWPPFEKNSDGTYSFPWLAIALLDVIVFGVNFFYFAAFEALWRGQTPGKRACHLRVIGDGGQALGGRGALVRNLVRTVDFLPVFYVVGVVTIFLGRRGKRLGDYAAGTMVVQEQAPSHFGATRAPGAGLSEDEATLIGEFLARRASLDPGARAELARQLADRLAQRQAAPPPADAETFVEGVARDGLR